MDRQALQRRIDAADERELRLIDQALTNIRRDDAEVRGQAHIGKAVPSAVCEIEGASSRPSHERVGLGNIEDVMAYQPWGPLETDRGNQVREALTNAAKVILRCVPEGRYRDNAVNGILQARMDSNAGISFRGRF